MNATPPVFQAQRSADLIQATAPAAADQTARSNSQDFAGALSDAGARTSRKHPAAKPQKSANQPAAPDPQNPTPSGSALPATGNPPPPGLILPPAKINAAAVPVGNSAAANSSQGAAVASNPAPTPAAPAATAGDPSNGTQPANGAQQPGAQTSNSPAAVSAAAAPPVVVVDAAARGTTPAATVFGAGPTMPHAPSIGSLTTVEPSDGAAPANPSVSTPTSAKTNVPPAPVAVSSTDAKPNDGPASKADIAAATSAPTSTDVNAQNASTQANVPSAADSDAAAQAVMAAAIAQGTSAPTPDSSAASDELATPDTGVTLQGVVAANDSPAAPLSGAPAAHAAAPTSASVTAASAASIVQAVTASADSSATDKHTHSDSSDGSVGAAQLLTSNAASDASPGPAPTFRVAAGVESAEFGQGVADRVSLMMDGNLTSAKLQVNPPALGPIEVRIALQGGHAQISLSSHSAVTRDALEATSPKLREMLGSQGFSQVSVDISQRSFHDGSRQPQPYERLPAGGGDSPALTQTAAAAARSASGLLDAYA